MNALQNNKMRWSPISFLNLEAKTYLRTGVGGYTIGPRPFEAREASASFLVGTSKRNSTSALIVSLTLQGVEFVFMCVFLVQPKPKDSLVLVTTPSVLRGASCGAYRHFMAILVFLFLFYCLTLLWLSLMHSAIGWQPPLFSRQTLTSADSRIMQS